jgi:ABC-type branched-subunit amino acid transport system ATPase component
MQSSVEDRLVQARRALNLGLIWPRTLETLKLYEAKIVALAMEYVCDTRILLMDEVTSGRLAAAVQAARTYPRDNLGELQR